MGQDMNRKLRLLIDSGIIFLIISSAYLIVKLAPVFSGIIEIGKTIIVPLLFSLVIAYLLDPIVSLIHNRGVPRGTAVVIIYFGFVLFLIVLLMNLIPMLVNQAQDFISHIPQLVLTYEKWLKEFNTHKYKLPEGIRLGIEHALGQVQNRSTLFFQSLVTGAGNVLSKILDLLIIPFIVFYLLKDMEMLHKGFLFFIPGKNRKEVAIILNDIDDALENYIGSQLIICLVVGVLAYIGYWFIDMPYALILALIITITDIIPFFGPFIGAAPSLLVAVTISWKMTLLVLAVNMVIQVIEGNIISPLIMGKRLHLHPLLIIIALLVGGEIGGILGLIFAVPITAILRVIAQHIVLHLVKH